MSLIGGFITNVLNQPATQKAAAGFLSGIVAGENPVLGPGPASGSVSIGGVTLSSGSSGSSNTKTDYVLYIVFGVVILVLIIVSLFSGKKRKR